MGTAQTDFTNKVKEVSDPSAVIVAVTVVVGIAVVMWMDQWYPPLSNAARWLFGN